MRRLLVVAAILFMAPAASALTVTLSYTGNLSTGGILQLDVTGATYDPYLAMVIEPPGVLSNFAAGPAAPSVSGSFGPVTIGGASGEVWGFGTAAGEPYQDGVWLTADWYSTVPVNAYVYETLNSGVTWILLDPIFVPEPMTIALLGLGGIFILRRRRK